MPQPSDPECHVCGDQPEPAVFCAPHALDRIRATPLNPDGGLLEVETTRGPIALRTDPGESLELVVQRAEKAIGHLA